MRVVFNALSSFRQRTGVGRYVAQLGAGLKQIAGDSVTAFPDRWMTPLAALAGKLTMRNCPGGSAGSASHLLPGSWASLRGQARRLARAGVKDLCERAFRRACRSGRFDLYHEPNFIPWESDLPTVVTVHDLSVVLHPEWHPADRVAFHREHFGRHLNRCRHVLTGSECMRREIIATMGLAPGRVTAIPNGVRSGLRPMTAAETAPLRAKLGLPEDYLLYVGTIEPRKNILTLLRAYCALDEALRSRCPLVLAGPWGWNYARERQYFDEEARHRGVIQLGYVIDADLPVLYAGATALVYPSHYEGFGLPPLEMMACGGAVLASTAGALREVCGRYAHFIAPADEAGWRDAMRRLLTDANWRAELRRGVATHAKQFSWERCAEQTWQAYQRIITANNPQLCRPLAA